MRALVTCRDPIQLRTCLTHGDTRAQSADYLQKMQIVPDLHVRSRARKVGNPDVHVAVGIRKTARHDADYSIIKTIHPERLSNRVAQTAEPPLPQTIADHHEPGRFEPVLIRKKCAAGKRRYAKRRKKISGTVAF